MNRIQIDMLRLRCAAALAAYHAHATNVLERAKLGEMAPKPERDAEEQALYEYAKLRRELLDALYTTVYVDRSDASV